MYSSKRIPLKLVYNRCEDVCSMVEWVELYLHVIYQHEQVIYNLHFKRLFYLHIQLYKKVNATNT